MICSDHQTRPTRYYIDARPFAAGKIYTDKRGKVFDSYLAATRQLEEMRAQVDRHTFDASQWVPAKLREFRIASEAEGWIKRCRKECSCSYWHQAKNVMQNYFVPRFGSMDVRDIRRYHLEAFRDELSARGRLPDTVKTFVEHVMAFFAWLERRELIEKVPSKPPVVVPYRERAWISRETQRKILREIPTRHRLLFELLIETGSRPGEIAALRIRDVEGGEIAINKAIDREGNVKGTKVGKVWYRSVPDDLYARLKAHGEGRFAMDFLFLNRYGNPYRTAGMWSIWSAAAKRAGCPIAMYPGTRHSRASQIRERRDEETYRMIAAEFGNTPAIVKSHYARPRREKVDLSVECPPSENEHGNILN